MERNVKCLVCKKNHIFFFQMSWKDVLSKKSCWNMIFLVLSGKMIFLFLENIILAFRRKMKDYLSQKNTWKYHIFFKCSEKMVFPKKSHWNMIFLVVLSGKMKFFSSKIWSYSLDENGRWSYSKKIHGNMIFSVYMYKCYKRDITLPLKKSKMIFSRKNTLKDDWNFRSHSRKSSNDSLNFYGDLHRRFHILLSTEKTRKPNV